MSKVDTKPLRADDVAAAFSWWRDAGVDLHFEDDVTDWLAKEGAAAPAQAPTVATHSVGDAKQAEIEEKIDLLGPEPPATLEAFRTWWMEAPGLDPAGTRGRIVPRGPEKAELLVLVADPEQGDRDKLLSQRQGALLNKILTAMGIAEDDVYFASVLPRHQPMTDGAALVASGHGDVLLHHIALAKPKKIVAFGANILPLLEHTAAQGPKSLREINHDGRRTPLMTSEGLDSMLAMPRLKARFWRKWLEWVEELQ